MYLLFVVLYETKLANGTVLKTLEERPQTFVSHQQFMDEYNDNPKDYEGGIFELIGGSEDRIVMDFREKQKVEKDLA